MAGKKHTIPEGATVYQLVTPEETEELEKKEGEKIPKNRPEVYVTYEMRQSIDVLIQGVEMGQKAGIYSFQDSTLIGQAINVLNDYRIK